MEEVTIEDLRQIIGSLMVAKIGNNIVLTNLSDDNLLKYDIEQNLPYTNAPMIVLKMLSKDKHFLLHHELYKCLPDTKVKTLIDTVNLYFKVAEELGINVIRKKG